MADAAASSSTLSQEMRAEIAQAFREAVAETVAVGVNPAAKAKRKAKRPKSEKDPGHGRGPEGPALSSADVAVGTHQPGSHGNRYGTCGIRAVYVPMRDAPAQTTQP